MAKNDWQLIVMKEKQHGMLWDEEKKHNFNYVGVATVKRKEQKEERMKGKKKGKERKYEESKKKRGRPGARFSKVPRTFRARKAIRKTTNCLFCKAGLLICCKENKNKNNCKVSCLETPSF